AGVTTTSVQPSTGTTRPSGAAALSRARTAVLPAAMTRDPAARAWLTIRAGVTDPRNLSGHGRSCASGDATPVCRRTGTTTTPRATRRVTTRSLNGRDALGISALPGSVANTVW